MSRPELMIIGDSLAQGCRSLSVKRQFCGQSYGARIAASQNWEFITPNHPRPVIFDFEQEIRKYIPGSIVTQLLLKSFPGIIKRLKNNITDWVSDFHSSSPITDTEFFHNLGVASFISADLTTTAGDFKSQALTYVDDTKLLELDPLPFLQKMVPLHMMINAAYVLNPSNQSSFEDKSALSWVAEKKPKRLVIQILHNDSTAYNTSIFGVGFQANFGLFSYELLQPSIEKITTALVNLPEEIEEIYFFLLPKVSSVANLRPSGKFSDGYAQSYRPVLYPTKNRLTGEDLKVIDESISDTNRDMEIHFREKLEEASPGNSRRLKFIDTYELFENYDFKNTQDSGRQLSVDRKRLDNRPLDGTPIHAGPAGKRRLVGYKLTEGGFQSVDGMHPSGLGYGVIATELMNKMGLDYSKPSIVTQSYQQDRLLTRFPRNVESIYGMISLAQRFLSSPEDKSMDTPDSTVAPVTLKSGARGRTEDSVPTAQFISSALNSVYS